jgi:hypothetical protein
MRPCNSECWPCCCLRFRQRDSSSRYAAAFDWKSTSVTVPKLDATLCAPWRSACTCCSNCRRGPADPFCRYTNLSGISRNGQGPPPLVRIPEIMNMLTNAFVQVRVFPAIASSVCRFY